MTTYTIKENINLKSGENLVAGEDVILLGISENKTSVKVYHVVLGKINISMGTFVKKVLGKKAPSMNTLEKWSNDGIAKSVAGKKVEPDGYDSEGFPSWLICLGMI